MKDFKHNNNRGNWDPNKKREEPKPQQNNPQAPQDKGYPGPQNWPKKKDK